MLNRVEPVFQAFGLVLHLHAARERSLELSDPPPNPNPRILALARVFRIPQINGLRFPELVFGFLEVLLVLLLPARGVLSDNSIE